MNWHSLLGVAALLVDVGAVVLTLIAVLTTRRLHVPVPRAAGPSAPVVDCLLPVHREEVSLVEATVLAATRISDVRRVLVLANAERPELAELCARLGAEYHCRRTDVHAKAGNLNNGLRHTDAEFVLVLDADHIARPDLLAVVTGYFDDPGVAYVQAPQSYYNTESFLFVSRRGHPAGWSEQYRYYLCDQLGRNAHESAFFMGSTAVLRRSALDSVGGFAQGSISEDVHTSLRLLGAGWRAVAVAEPLAFGLEAPNPAEFHKQRHRWAAGALNLLFRSADGPVRAPRLPLAVRLAAAGGICLHLAGSVRLGLLLVPLVVLVTGQSPTSGPPTAFGSLVVGWAALSALVHTRLARGYDTVAHRGATSFGVMFAQLAAMKGLLLWNQRFVSSRKLVAAGAQHWTVWALGALLAVSLPVVVLSGYRLATGHGTVLTGAFCVLLGAQTLLLLHYLVRVVRLPGRLSVLDHLAPADRYRHVLDEFSAGRIGIPEWLRHRARPATAAASPGPPADRRSGR